MSVYVIYCGLSVWQNVDCRLLEGLKRALLAVKMHHLVDGHGKFQFVEHHSLDSPVRIDVVVL